MDAREVCFLLGKDDSVLWADASTSPVALPDSRARWEQIWRLREDIVEIAHTHPQGGLKFSNEDLTTMAALDAALGRRLRYAIVTPDAMLRRHRNEDGDEDAVVDAEPWWTALIRAASGISPTAKEQ